MCLRHGRTLAAVVASVAGFTARRLGGLVGLAQHRRSAVNFVFPHIQVHVFPAGKNCRFRRIGVERVAVLKAAQRMATAAAYRFGVRVALNNPWVRNDTGDVTAGQQQQRKSSD